MFIKNKAGGIKKRIEVKEIFPGKNWDSRFNRLENFFYPEVIVDAKITFDRKVDQGKIPILYFILSSDWRGIAVIDVAKTRDKWRVRDTTDSRYSGAKNYDTYRVHKRQVDFYPIQYITEIDTKTGQSTRIPTWTITPEKCWV